MNNDAVQRLREPGALVLLGSAALHLLGGLISLVTDGGVPVTLRAFYLVTGDKFFTGMAVVGVVVVAVLLATRWGGGPTPQARNIALGGVILLGAIAVFEALCVLVGLAAGTSADDVTGVGVGPKAAMFVYGISKLAVVAVGGYYLFTIFQAFAPARPSTGPYPQQGYAQQSPYGGYGQPQQPYGQPPQGQPYQPQQGYYQPSQPYQQQPPAGQAQPSDGEWTVAYGAGEQQDPPKDAEPGDPYRPPQ